MPLRSRKRKLLYAAVPLVHPRRWLSHQERLARLWRPYQASCLLLRRREGSLMGSTGPRLAG